jgi:hypothetical protein
MSDPIFPYLSTVSIVGIIGNIIVVFVYSNKKDRQTTTFFILVLAFSDLTVCSVLVPLTLYFEYILFATTNMILCKMYFFFLTTTVPASCLLMTAIAFDRLFCICMFNRNIMTRRRAHMIVIVLLMISALLGIVPASYVNIQRINFDSNGTVISPDHPYFLNDTILKSNMTSQQIVCSFPDLGQGILNFFFFCCCCFKNRFKIFPHFFFQLFIASYLKYFKYFYDLIYILSVVVISVLYVIIYRDIYKRRKKKRDRKRTLIYNSMMNGANIINNKEISNINKNKISKKEDNNNKILLKKDKSINFKETILANDCNNNNNSGNCLKINNQNDENKHLLSVSDIKNDQGNVSTTTTATLSYASNNGNADDRESQNKNENEDENTKLNLIKVNFQFQK